MLEDEPSILKVHEVLTIGRDGELKPKARRGRPRGKVQTISSKKSASLDDIILPLRIACDFVFGLPVTLGWGKHWELNDDEANDLATSIKDVLEAFPSDTTQAFIVALEKYIPLLTLGMTLYQITKPRIAITRAMIAEQKRIDAQNEQTEKARTPAFVN